MGPTIAADLGSGSECQLAILTRDCPGGTRSLVHAFWRIHADDPGEASRSNAAVTDEAKPKKGDSEGVRLRILISTHREPTQ